jgi:quercetin dioxygenase-like cupin family protein
MRRHHLEFDRFFDVVSETDTAQAAEMTLGSGQSTGGPDNFHADSDQWLFVHSGSGWAIVDGEKHDLTTGDVVCIEAGECHEIGANEDEPIETVSLYVPPRKDR